MTACNSRGRVYLPVVRVTRHGDPHAAASAGDNGQRRRTPKPFDMAAHRKQFGEFWGAQSRALGKAIREGRV